MAATIPEAAAGKPFKMAMMGSGSIDLRSEATIASAQVGGSMLAVTWDS